MSELFIPEIPLFHILNACITFGNLYAKQEPVEGVTNVVVQDLSNPDPLPVAEAQEVDPDRDVDATEAPMMVCSVDPSVFEVPEGYGLYQSREVRYGEDELLQLAIQQSLMEGSNDPDQVRRQALCLKTMAPPVPDSYFCSTKQLLTRTYFMYIECAGQR